jgi:hypothetical protein
MIAAAIIPVRGAAVAIRHELAASRPVAFSELQIQT